MKKWKHTLVLFALAVTLLNTTHGIPSGNPVGEGSTNDGSANNGNQDVVASNLPVILIDVI